MGTTHGGDRRNMREVPFHSDFFHRGPVVAIAGSIRWGYDKPAMPLPATGDGGRRHLICRPGCVTQHRSRPISSVERGRAMKLSLVVQTPGSNQGKVLEIKRSPFVVGRDPPCHLRPASPMISQRHCAVLQRDNKAFVRDLESSKGTFVNEEQVKGEVELHDGDRLKMGPLFFEVKIEGAAPVNRPAVVSRKPAAKANTPASSVDQKASSQPAVARKPSGAASAGATDTQTDAPAAQVDTQTETSAEGGVSSNDDDIAAMLLSLGDDSSDGPFGGGSEVPEGSSVPEMPPPPDLAAQRAKERERAKPAAPANTSKAAKGILDKYRTRPRE